MKVWVKMKLEENSKVTILYNNLDFYNNFRILQTKTMKKHPYYDSDQKKRTEEAALKMIAICFVGMLVLLIFAKIFS